MRWLASRVLRLALVFGLFGGVACSDDTTPGRDGARPADGSSLHGEALASCSEGEKHCATLLKIQICQGGTWVDFADCTNKKDPAGNACTCSVTLMGVCQAGGQVCP